MQFNKKKTVLIVMLIAVFFAGMTVANYRFFTGANQYQNRDFISLWAGGIAVIEGLNPYDEAVWEPLRLRLGTTWIPDSREPFPLWTILFFVPFSLFSLGWSSALWISFSLVMLGLSLYLLVNEFHEQRLSLVMFFLLTLGAALFRGGLLTLVVGQITFLLMFFVVMFVMLEKRKRPFLAGLFLALLMFKPNPLYLILAIDWGLAFKKSPLAHHWRWGNGWIAHVGCQLVGYSGLAF